METTIYKLLGMVVEGKAPNKIKYDGQEWKYNPINDYEGVQYGGYLLNQVTLDHLNDKVEIIEEELKENKLPQKIDQNNFEWKYIYSKKSNKEIINNLTILRLKYNEIIDYLKSKGE